ncbi:MAG TPA: NUDIX domain-containing protein [Syntrophomonadaceae bacterium]|nr:NUDIX domain-containing protein [Syntrophomonadaceae bacterium]
MCAYKIYTLCLILNENYILLQRRGKSPFKGKWNAPGGKVEVGESIEEACIREIFEETSLKLNDIKLVGAITVQDTKIYVFASHHFTGNIVANQEGQLYWLPISFVEENKNDVAYFLDWFLDHAMRYNNNSIVEISF